MSLETWKAIYYPPLATDSELEAAAAICYGGAYHRDVCRRIDKAIDGPMIHQWNDSATWEEVEKLITELDI